MSRMRTVCPFRQDRLMMHAMVQDEVCEETAGSYCMPSRVGFGDVDLMVQELIRLMVYLYSLWLLYDHGGPGSLTETSTGDEPGRADTVVPGGYDRLCVAAAGSSMGSESPWQPGHTAKGGAMRSSSSGPVPSEPSSLRGAGGDWSWSGSAARTPGETSARSPLGETAWRRRQQVAGARFRGQRATRNSAQGVQEMSSLV